MLDMTITHLTPGHLVLQWIPFEECEEVSLLYGVKGRHAKNQNKSNFTIDTV